MYILDTMYFLSFHILVVFPAATFLPFVALPLLAMLFPDAFLSQLYLKKVFIYITCSCIHINE